MVHIPSEQEFGDYADWSGRPALDRDGTALGRIEEIFLDTETRMPEWVLVRLQDADGHRLVPLTGARIEGETLRVDHDRERIHAAPPVGDAGPIPQERESELYRHYGLEYSHEGSGTGLPTEAADDTPAQSDAAAVVAPGPVPEAPEPVAAAPEPVAAAPEPVAPAPAAPSSDAPRLRRVEVPATEPGGDLDREQAREDLAEAPAAPGQPSDAPPAVDFEFPGGAPGSLGRSLPADPKILAGGGAALLLALFVLLRRLRS
jgi:hypothetical protein